MRLCQVAADIFRIGAEDTAASWALVEDHAALAIVSALMKAM
jgi:hypothetical protein